MNPNANSFQPRTTQPRPPVPQPPPVADAPSLKKRRKKNKNKQKDGPRPVAQPVRGELAEIDADTLETAIAASRDDAPEAPVAQEKPGPTVSPEPEPADTAEVEEARAASYERFTRVLGEAAEWYWDGAPSPALERKVLDEMGLYRALAGEYPYDSLYPYSPGAFTEYLKTEGIKPEIYEDVRALVRTAIEEGSRFPWDTFRATLDASKHACADRTLFLWKIGRGGARVLCEAAQLGFVDRRFEHAIVTLQRLVRYRRATPRAEGVDRRAWIAAFEKAHHAPDPSWRENLIHLKSFAETDRRFPDETDENSFVSWNRRCIPGYIAEYVRQGGTLSSYEFSYGVMAATGFDNYDHLVATKKDALYRKQISHLLDDDAVAKTGILIRLHAEKRLHVPRDSRRDILKFISFELNEPAPTWVPRSGAPGAKAVPIATCYLDRLEALPFHVADEIFRVLPGCLATRGRDILQRFAKINVATLDEEGVRRWFLDVVIDEVAHVCEGTEVDEKAFRFFLDGRRAEIGPGKQNGTTAAVALARSLLVKAHADVLAGKALYTYKVWVEPVRVTAVTLVPEHP